MQKILIATILSLLFFACSDPYPYQAHIVGNISVDDSLASGESDADILIQIYTQNLNETVDTLLSVRTDDEGNFSGDLGFPNPGPYPMKISRFGRQISVYSVILGNQDTVNISGKIPNFTETVVVSSRENEAYQTFQRVEKGYTRILNFIRRGSFEQDTIPKLVRTWSDLYWSVWKEYPESYGGYLAQAQSANMISSMSDSIALSRLRQMDTDPYMVRASAILGMRLLSRMKGLNAALRYADSLKTNADKYDQANITQFQIDVMFDSLKVADGQKLFAKSRSEFGEIRAYREWASEFEDDFGRLAPGEKSPDYTLWFGDQSISSDSLNGTAVLLEFSGMGNRAYQNQYDRMKGLHSVYQNYGLQIVTIPVDTSRIAVEAFVQEYGQFWPFTDNDNYLKDSLQTKFNITRLPTRILIDKEGNIVRKYVGDKLTLLFEDVLNLFKNDGAS